MNYRLTLVLEELGLDLKRKKNEVRERLTSCNKKKKKTKDMTERRKRRKEGKKENG